MKTLYTAHATATGREGHAETNDKRLVVELARPGSSKQGTNPEQLFACGYAACFGSAVQHVAGLQKIMLEKVEVKADITLHQDETGFFLSATLNVTLLGIDNATAASLVQQAHTVCPYSKATKGNIDVTLKVDGQELKKAA